MIQLEEIYTKILSEIEQGHRGLVRLTSIELDFLNTELERSLDNSEKLKKVLCIVEHSATLYGPFEKNIIKVLTSPLPETHLIFALNCSRKHIIEARFSRGQRLEYEFLETLRALLYHSNPEIVEWTLRTIEGAGNQGVYFLKEFDKIKPPLWKWFNSHQRAVVEIITLLQRRWSSVEKPKS